MNLHELMKKTADLLLPKARCLGCDEPRQIREGAALCARCEQELDSLRTGDLVCPHCQSPKPKYQTCAYCANGGMQGLDSAFAAFLHKDLAQKLVVSLKFDPVEQAAAPLAREMALCITGRRFDALVPVPLHPLHQRVRGMNQSRILCDLISEETGMPVKEALVKQRKTKRQSSLSAEKRKDNIKGAFICQEDLTGMEILLVDDVRTTGSTARECAKQLQLRGAASVSLLTATVAGHKVRTSNEQV